MRARGDQAQGPGRLAAVASALALFALALGLRMVGLDQGIPHTPESDTYIVIQADEMVRHGLTDRHRAGWKYPHLVATIVAALPGVPEGLPGEGATLEQHLEAVRWLHFRTRLVVALLSALAVPTTFFIALRFVSTRWAWLASLLLSSSLLHICFSTQARPHGPVAAFVMLGVLASIRWAERPTLGRAAIMGLAAAASISTLHTGLSVLGAVAVAVGFALRRQPDPTVARRLRRTALQLSVTAVIIAVAGGWFYIRDPEGHGSFEPAVAKAKTARESGVGSKAVDERLEEWRETEEGVRGAREFRISGHVIPLDLFRGGGFVVAWAALRQYDPFVLGFALLGLLVLFAAGPRRAPPGFWILAGFAAPTLLLYGAYDRSTARFYLVLVPATCLVAMVGMRWVATRPRWGRGAAALVSLLALLVLLAAAQTARLRSRPDTLTQTAAWLHENVDQGTSVHATNLFALPVFGRSDVLDRDSSWSRGPWDTYQWYLLRPKAPGFPGLRSETTEPRTEPAERLGFTLHQTNTKERFQIVLGPGRAEAAAGALERTGAEVAFVAVSEAFDQRPTPPLVIRDAWLEALEQQGGWTVAATIGDSGSRGRPYLGYQLEFFDVFRRREFGPVVDVYRRE